MERLRHYFHIDLATILEADRAVLKWTTELKPYQLRADDEEISFRPHFLVTNTTGETAICLMRGRKRRRPSMWQQLLGHAFAHVGMSFTVLAEQEVAEDPRLPTAKEILFNRYRDLPEEIPLAVATMELDQPPETLGDLADRLGPPEVETWNLVCCLVANRHVEIDLESGLTRKTPIVALALRSNRP